jgi:hypothetical protein
MAESTGENVLGVDKRHREILTNDEYTANACLLVTQAERFIRIYTHDLEREIYDNNAFRDALSLFARKHSNTEVHILIEDIQPTLKQNHLVLELSRRLSSSITIRQTDIGTEDNAEFVKGGSEICYDSSKKQGKGKITLTMSTEQ